MTSYARLDGRGATPGSAAMHSVTLSIASLITSGRQLGTISPAPLHAPLRRQAERSQRAQAPMALLIAAARLR